MSKYNNYINNSAFSLNTTEYNKGLLAYSTNNNNVSINLVNNIYNEENKDYSINSSNNIFSIKQNENDIIKYDSNIINLLDDVKINNKLDVKEIDNVEKYKSIKHKFISEDTDVFEITKNITNIKNDIYLDGYFNISNIHKLPKEIPLLNEYGKLDPELFPTSTNNNNFIYGEGSNVGIGTFEPHSKLHIYNGHTIFESGYIAINPLSNILEPECPLHIRSRSNRIGEPVIKLTDSNEKDRIIICSEEPFIGIGTSSRITYGHTQLYIESNVQCDGNMEVNSLNIGSNIILKGETFKLDVEIEGDIRFENRSTKDAILKFYGNSNMSFGRGNMDPDYRLDILHEKESLLSIGTNNNNNPEILLYKNDNKEEGIKLSYEEDNKVSINGYNIITENTIGNIGYLNKIELNDIYKNPLNIINVDENNIKQIIVYTNHTFILLENGTLLHIYDNIPYKYNIWFDEKIIKLEESSGLLLINTENNKIYFTGILDNTVKGKITNVKSVTYENSDVNKRFHGNDITNQIFSIYYDTTQIINELNSNENIKNGTYNIKKIKSKNDIILFITEDNKLYRLKYEFGSDNIYENIMDNVIDFVINNEYIYILGNDNIVYKINIVNINDNIQIEVNVKEISISDNYILYIYLNNIAKLYNITTENIEEINLIEDIFNKKTLFNKCEISNSHLVLLDINNKLIYTRSLLSNTSILGLGRPIGSIYGSYSSTTLIPVSVELTDKVLNSKNSVTIGKTLEYFGNNEGELLDNSLFVEKSVGIRTKPEENYALTVYGNIKIINGSIITNGNILEEINTGSGQLSYSSNIDLTGYIRKETFIKERDRINTVYYDKEYINENYINVSSNEGIISSIVNNKFEELKEIESENRKYLWNIKNEDEYDMLYVNNVTVGINTCNLNYTNDDILGISVVPALYVANSGNIRGAIFDGDIASFSDISLKDNIEPLKNSLEKILKLNGKSYHMKDDNNKKKCIGLIAQEVETVIPEIVSEFQGKKTIAYMSIIGILIESIKELNEKIKVLSNIKNGNI